MRAQFKTIQKLRDFVASLDPTSLIKGTISNGLGQGCIIGQINNELSGNFNYEKYTGPEDQKSLKNLRSLGIDPFLLVYINNAEGDTKTNVLNFLDNLLE